MTAHALLSASSADRWLACPPSARLEEPMSDRDSIHTLQGTLAHAIGELKLRNHFIEPMTMRKYNTQLKKLQNSEPFEGQPLYEDEMLRHTDTYLDYISQVVHSYNSPPFITVEKRVDYSEYVPKGFGTSDCIIIGGNNIHVIDFKYGKGVQVTAENNPQMKLYALGALLAYSMLFDIKTVKLSIVQPRRDNISEWELSSEELFSWANSIKPTAQMAFNGKGDYAAGDHCRFCKAKALCRARSEFNISLEEYNFTKPPLLSDEEVGHVLTKALDLKSWAKAIEEYALEQCLIGNSIPGWKAVNGRGNRQFTDVDEALNKVEGAGFDKALLYKNVPSTLTEIETLLGKKEFDNLLNGYVIKPLGKPTLVPENDKREAISNKVTPEEAFAEKIQGGE